jgi:hypothetical protein
MNILIPPPELKIENQNIQTEIILSLTKIIKVAIQEIHPIIEIISQEIKEYKIIIEETNLVLVIIIEVQLTKIMETKIVKIILEEINPLMKIKEANLIIETNEMKMKMILE